MNILFLWLHFAYTCKEVSIQYYIAPGMWEVGGGEDGLSNVGGKGLSDKETRKGQRWGHWWGWARGEEVGEVGQKACPSLGDEKELPVWGDIMNKFSLAMSEGRLSYVREMSGEVKNLRFGNELEINNYLLHGRKEPLGIVCFSQVASFCLLLGYFTILWRQKLTYRKLIAMQIILPR